MQSEDSNLGILGNSSINCGVSGVEIDGQLTEVLLHSYNLKKKQQYVGLVTHTTIIEIKFLISHSIHRTPQFHKPKSPLMKKTLMSLKENKIISNKFREEVPCIGISSCIRVRLPEFKFWLHNLQAV